MVFLKVSKWLSATIWPKRKGTPLWFWTASHSDVLTALVDETRAVKSNWNRIEFPYRIESFCLYRIESNADRIKWNFRFSKRFDSIWSVQKGEQENPELWLWRLKISLNNITKMISRYFRDPGGQSLYKIGQLPNSQIISWLLRRFLYRIESFLNQIDIELKSNRIERFLHLVNRKLNRIENQFDLTALDETMESGRWVQYIHGKSVIITSYSTGS